MARVKVVKRSRSDEDANPNKRPRRAGPSEPVVAQEDAPVPLPPDFYDKLISMPFDIAFEVSFTWGKYTVVIALTNLRTDLQALAPAHLAEPGADHQGASSVPHELSV